MLTRGTQTGHPSTGHPSAGHPGALAPSTPAPEVTRPSGARGLAIRLGRDLRALATPRGVTGAAVESAWLAAHLAMYPMGILRERRRAPERYNFEGLTPRQRSLIMTNVDAATTPILLVHGMLDNRAIFAVLIRRLRSYGFTRVVTLNYSPITNDIRSAAEGLAAAVEELVGQTGYERIHIVGHSLGGLIARYYVQRLGGDERVHTLVTLGTPHHGSLAAHVLPSQLGRQLRPGSDLFAELAEPAPGNRTKFLAFWSDIDQLVVPHDNGRLIHPDLTVRNEPVHGVGHLSLPISVDVVQRVSQALSELNSDGSTLSAGVTPIH